MIIPVVPLFYSDNDNTVSPSADTGLCYAPIPVLVSLVLSAREKKETKSIGFRLSFVTPTGFKPVTF